MAELADCVKKRSILAERLPHVLALDNHVEHAVFEQVLGTLKTRRERLADGLLDHTRAGKTDQRFGLGDVDVPEHREARRHPARGGIGEDGDVRDLRVVETRERRADLGHLHERDGPFLHPRSSGPRHDDERRALGKGMFGGSRDLFANHNAHAAADETIFHGREQDGDAIDAPAGDENRVIEAGRFLAAAEPVAVLFRVGENERVVREKTGFDLFESLVVENRFRALHRAEAHVVVALRANIQVPDDLLRVEDLRTLAALRPEPLGHPALLDPPPAGASPFLNQLIRSA